MRLSFPALLFALVLAGCSSNGSGDGLTSKDETLSSRTDEIVKKSGGNWDAVSADDKAYLTREIGYGNEQSAKMFFMGMSGGLKKGGPGPGGPPAGH